MLLVGGKQIIKMVLMIKKKRLEHTFPLLHKVTSYLQINAITTLFDIIS